MAASKPHALLAAGKVSEPLIIGVSIAVLLAVFWTAHRTASWLRRLRDVEPRMDRRRAHRVLLSTPLFVYGWLRAQPFWENTETMDISAIGGLIPLSVSVVRSQRLIITNVQSNEDLTCRVARLAHTSDGKTAIGFEFAQASPKFWQVDFISSARNSNQLF
jgi:hypothetical protein